MPLLSVTRLRIRSIWFLPKFIWYSMKSLNQANKSQGIVKAKTLMDANMTFWTVSLWDDEAAMRKYMSSGEHKKAMPYLQRWCNEAATANTIIDQPTLPSADFLFDLIKTKGRPSKLNRPNANHENKNYAAPKFMNYNVGD